MNRRLLQAVAAFLLLLTCGGWFPHGSMGVGKAQLNLGYQELTAQTFINVFNSAQTSPSGAAIAVLDQYGLPTANFSGLITGQVGPTAPTLSTTGPWILGWDAGRSCFKLNFLNSATVISTTGSPTYVNGAGTGNFSVTGSCGQAGTVTFTFSTTGIINYQFDGSYAQWASNTGGRFYLIRQSDQTAFNNGVFWTPEFVSLIKALHPESIRPMGWNILLLNGLTATDVVNWSYRKTTNAFSFAAVDYPPGARCGGATSFCTMTVAAGAGAGAVVTSAPAADTSLSGWVDGEQIMGTLGATVPAMPISSIATNGGNCQFTVPDTTNLAVGMPVFVVANSCSSQSATVSSIDSPTQFTINVAFTATCASSCGNVAYQTLSITGKSGGPKIILGINGAPIISSGSCALNSGNIVTFTYFATLNAVVACGNASYVGISNPVPIEAQAQLANLVNANLWYNFPTWANDNYVTNASNLIYSNLNANLKGIFEWSNEVWNFGQSAAQWSTQMGIALGISTNTPHPYQSLRVRQINGNLLPASSWSTAASRLERTYCVQAGAFAAGAVTHLSGSELSGYGYNTYPNRPIDFTESVCYAPYVGGGTALSGQSPDLGYTPTTYDAPLLNSIISDWNGGNTAGAISLIDQSVRGDVQNRVQTVTASGTTFTTPSAHNLSTGNIIRFTVSGGTTYSGLNLLATYEVLSTPTSTTFTAGLITGGVAGSAVNAGTAGSGTTSVGYLDSSLYSDRSIFGIMSAPYTSFQSMAATGFSPAPATAPLKVRWYEGAIEVTAPSTAQCSSIGINSTDCGTLAMAVTAWKNDPSASVTTQYYFNTFKGTQSGTITSGAMPNSYAPSWLVLMGGGVWSMVSNSSFVSPAPYQTYYGFQTYSAP